METSFLQNGDIKTGSSLRRVLTAFSHSYPDSDVTSALRNFESPTSSLLIVLLARLASQGLGVGRIYSLAS